MAHAFMLYLAPEGDLSGERRDGFTVAQKPGD